VQPERGDNGMVFLDAGGDCVILAQVDQPISTARVRDIHHAFKVPHEDYTKARAELESKGVKVLFEEDRQGGAVNGPRFYFHDPDGNVLEIIDLTSYKGDR
jgi:catechol 2,3-dioxygenase-like lactoylglutathione lyase family enzyme